MITIFKKLKYDEKYMKIALYIFGILAAAILFEKILGHLGHITAAAKFVADTAKKLSAPFLIGFAIAYLVNPCVNFFEKTCLTSIIGLQKKVVLRRTLAILLTYLIFIGGITWLVVYFIPEISMSLSTFFIQLPKYMSGLESAINTFFAQIDFVNGHDVNILIGSLMKPVITYTKNAPLMLQTILDSTFIAASNLLNAVMGIFIAFYMLMDKEKFILNIRKTIYALCDQKKSDQFFKNILRVHGVFQNFIVGKTLDSTVIGIICFVGLSILKAPYITVISLIIGITNMIPYFGPFIGAIPALLITLLIDPSKVLWVGLFILALQQFDGIILGPKILGNSTGMSPIWIILSIIIGGAVMGPLGMFLGVPIFASLKLFFSEYVDRKYREKYLYDTPLQSASPVKEKKKKE